MDYSSTVLMIFSGITLLSLIVKTLMSKSSNSKGSTTLFHHSYVDYVYFFIVFLLNLGFFIAESNKNCGSVSWSHILYYLIGPWFLIFGGLIMVLNVYPYLLYPFSNTFGYLVASMLGVNNLLINFLKSPNSTGGENASVKKSIEEIYTDKSLFLNVFNDIQFEDQFNNFKSLFQASKIAELKDELFYFVSLKDDISRYMWFFLTGVVIISYSFMELSGVKCNYTKGTIKQMHDKQDTLIKDHLEEQGKPKKIYKQRD